MGSLDDKFVNFDQKFKTHWIFGWQQKIGVVGWGVSWKGVLRTTYLRIWDCPPGFKFVLKIYEWYWFFATPAGGHKCIKEHLECSSKSGNECYSWWALLNHRCGNFIIMCECAFDFDRNFKIWTRYFVRITLTYWGVFIWPLKASTSTSLTLIGMSCLLEIYMPGV